MKGRTRKVLALTMVAATAMGTLVSGCGNKKADSDTSYTMLIDMQQDERYFSEYEDGPVQQYWMSQKWDADGDGEGKSITVDFSAPPKGSESDYVNTLLATGEYPDVMSINLASESAAQLYDEGIAIDLTEYIDKYMPNYKAWVERHPEYESRITNEIDGERKYIQLYNLADVEGDMWGGYVYRRDWIVTYGKNPATGAAFTGGYDADGNWSDDVVFPSGNDVPVYISDWEWMFDIFETALKEENLSDGYAFSQSYAGCIGTGDGIGGFNTSSNWYMDGDKAVFGGDSDNFRSFVECMKNWYDKGWMDPDFEEHASDQFFMIDTQKVYAGKVGLWWGMISQTGNKMDASGGDTSNPTNGIYVAAAPQPINDVYGDEDCKGREPVVYFTSAGLVNNGVVLTNKVKDKDIPTLLTAIDYLYSEEGSLLKCLGFSDEYVKENPNELFTEYDFKGGYFMGTKGDYTTYKVNSQKDEIEGIAEATTLNRLPGLNTEGLNMDKGLSAVDADSYAQWKRYSNNGYISNDITGQLSTEQSQENSSIQTNVGTYMSQAIPDFITGRKDITSDADWKEYCDTLEEYKAHNYEKNINDALGN